MSDIRGLWLRATVLAWCALALPTGCGGCTDDAVEQNNAAAEECGAGERLNPITGECEPARTNGFTPPTNNSMGDMGDAADMGGEGDMPSTQMDMRPPPPDMPMVMVDLGDNQRCAPGIDSDGDGLDNDCECNFRPSPTDPGNSDTDGDGLPDGYEDANGDCQIAGIETLPTAADTDGDQVNDGDEVNDGLNPLKIDTDDDGVLDGVEYTTCLDPLSVDTDGDGIEDGLEDLNKDGKIGICADRMYEPVCAQGEYDPCAADTDGDGEEDGEEVNFLGCRDEFLQAIPAPNTLVNQAADYQLAIAQQAQGAPVSGVDAHAFNHAQESYAGFIISVPRPAGSIEDMRGWLLGQLQSQFPGASLERNGRRTLTHDNHDGIVSIKIDMGEAGRADSLRDRALRAVAGTGMISHGLGGTFNPSVGNIDMVAGVIDRGNRLLITAALASGSVYEARNLATGYLMDDTTSSMSVASASEALENACVAYRVDDRPKVDFIWVIDGSGSMDEENNLVKNYANDFVQILTASNLSWRLGVVSSHCADIANDPAISTSVKQLFGPGGSLASACPSLPFGGGSGMRNGMLCDRNGANFTTDPQKFKDCVAQAASQAIVTEYTVTVATAAIDRALPRAVNDPRKLREGAATVIISVTDEFDDFISSKMGWRDAGSASDPPNDLSSGIDYAQLDSIVQPFVDFLRTPDAAATVFGIFWIPGQPCATASEAAAGIERVVDMTGGTAGNICSGNLQTTLATIAEASAGLASGLRLRGVPLPSTLDVRVGDVSTQMIATPDRSRQQGWDYDAVTNAVSFNGADPPQTNDRVVITYKRWVNSVQGCQTDQDCDNGFQKYQCRDGVCI